jgi:hypothetical protein
MSQFNKLKKIYHRISLYLFGNTLGVYLNVLYLMNHFLSKKKTHKNDLILYKHQDKDLEIRCQQLLENGTTFLKKQDNTKKLKKKFELFFSDKYKDKYSDYISPGYRFLKREMVMKFQPEIKDIIDNKIDPFLKKYYESYYKIFWVNILQMTPVKNYKDDESLLWHYDDNPKGILKIFIYCSQQDKDTGAFTFINLKKSEKIKREGFFTYTTEDRVKSQTKLLNKITKSDINIASGEEGSILVFQNNIIHKGSLPLKDKRNLIALEVLPSTTKMNNNDLTKALNKPFTIDFPKNPFLNN